MHACIESSIHHDKQRIIGTETLNDVVSSVIGDYIQDLYFDTQQQEDEYRLLWDGIKQSRKISPLGRAANSASTVAQQRNSGQLQRDYIMRDLFLWAVFMNRIDMAKIFLAHMKYRICAALIATKILKTYYGQAEFGDIKDSYKTSADYFEQYAIECIKLCYKNNPEQACEIVLHRITLFGDVTCLQVKISRILKAVLRDAHSNSSAFRTFSMHDVKPLVSLQVAANAQDKAFIAMPCCVQALNSVWYDKIRPEQSRNRDQLTLFLGFISFGLLAPIAINFRQNEV